MISDRPYLHRAAGPGLRIGYLQALHAEQHRRRILEHDARGFLVILKSVGRPKIVGAAGSLIRGDTPVTGQSKRTRQDPASAGHPSGNREVTQSYRTTPASRLTSKSQICVTQHS